MIIHSDKTHCRFRLRASSHCSPFTPMKPEAFAGWSTYSDARWSAYSVALYVAQRPPPLGTVDTGEKLEQMAREHITRVAGEGRGPLELFQL